MNHEKKVLFVTVGTSALSARDLGWKLEKRRCEGLRKKAQGFLDNGRKDTNLFEEVVNAHLAHRPSRDRPGDYLKDLRRTSAEMTSTFLLLQDGDELPGPFQHGRDQIVLLSSDTEQGWFCAAVNAAVMRELFFSCSPKEPCAAECVVARKVHGLKAEEDAAKTIPAIRPIIEPFRGSGSQLFFNITGGYKGAIPAISWLCGEAPAIPMYYVHEKGFRAVRTVLPWHESAKAEPECIVTPRVFVPR